MLNEEYRMPIPLFGEIPDIHTKHPWDGKGNKEKQEIVLPVVPSEGKPLSLFVPHVQVQKLYIYICRNYI